jgi:hypothetical protein
MIKFERKIKRDEVEKINNFIAYQKFKIKINQKNKDQIRKIKK